MNPAAVDTLLQLPPDPVVYRIEIRAVGWPEIWNDDVWLKLDGLACSISRIVVLSAKVTSGPVTALVN